MRFLRRLLCGQRAELRMNRQDGQMIHSGRNITPHDGQGIQFGLSRRMPETLPVGAIASIAYVRTNVCVARTDFC
jgi:hypothetical protein